MSDIRPDTDGSAGHRAQQRPPSRADEIDGLDRQLLADVLEALMNRQLGELRRHAEGQHRDGLQVQPWCRWHLGPESSARFCQRLEGLLGCFAIAAPPRTAFGPLGRAPTALPGFARKSV